MAGLFSGLEAFGLDNLSNIKVYEHEKNTGVTGVPGIAEETEPKITEADLIFDKSYICPVCSREFKSKTVKTGKVKLISMDTDLRPKYQMMDSLKYDAVVCPHCGYAALSRFFNYMTETQAKLVNAQISKNFKSPAPAGDIYTYDEAITRHKLALVNTIVKKSKLSEKAYTCLKTAWLLRGKAEALPSDTPNLPSQIALLAAEENEFIQNAYEGFMEAFTKELFPMCGMDENTCTYLVADLARRLGRNDEALRWLSKVITARDANERIKSKAREIKDIIMAEKGINNK